MFSSFQIFHVLFTSWNVHKIFSLNINENRRYSYTIYEFQRLSLMFNCEKHQSMYAVCGILRIYLSISRLIFFYHKKRPAVFLYLLRLMYDFSALGYVMWLGILAYLLIVNNLYTLE